MTPSNSQPRSNVDVGVHPGDTIGGRYEIVRLLGAGGMGAVFEARHKAIGKTVAIKVLHPDVARDAMLAPRFLQEARAANEVRHKNIVEILDFGVENERPYMVLEYLHGESLASLLERERWLPPGRIVRVLEPVMRALAFAHQRGIVHRDIKPDNIFLAEEEGEDASTPKILDFGIAKQTLPDNPRLTKTMTGLGTPSYMAPEQIVAARDVTPAADQYAIGAILYEALCGRRSHAADSYEALIVAKATQSATPLEERHPQIDPGLAKVVMRSLAISPGDRFESVLALRDALAPYRDALESPEPPNLPARAEPRSEPEHPSSGATRGPMGEAPTVASGPPRNRPRATSKTETPETWTTGTSTRSEREPQPDAHATRRTGAWIGLAIVLVVAGVATAGWRGGLFGDRMRDATSPETAAASTAPGPNANPPAVTPPAARPPIVIRVRVQPLAAEIQLDGSPVGHGAVELTRPRDGRHYHLVLQAPGYVTSDEEFVASDDAIVDRVLAPLTVAASAQAPDASTAGATPRPHPAGGGRPGGRGSHGYPTLDRSNPF